MSPGVMPSRSLRMRVADRRDRDVRRRLHQRDLGRRLDHPAAAHDRVGVAHREPRQLLPCSRSTMKKRLVSSIPIGAAVSLRSRSQSATSLQRLLMLVPGADFGGDAEAFGDRRLFEEGRDDDRIADRRDERRGQPFGPAPSHPGEIIEARARLDQDRAEAFALHQRARLGEAGEALGRGDRRRQRRRVCAMRHFGQRQAPPVRARAPPMKRAAIKRKHKVLRLASAR